MNRVAVIGGGLAGLTCAFYLKQRGIPAVVFESSSQPGGRVSAATYLLGPDVYSNTFQWIRDLGMEGELREIEPVAGQFYKGHVYYHRVSSVTGLLKFKGLNILDKAMLSRMAYLLNRHRSQLNFHHPERGSDLDKESVASFVKRELSQNILNYIAGPLISTLFFCGSEETSILLYLNLAKHMHNTRLYTVRDGIPRIVAKSAENTAIALNQSVKTIESSGPSYAVNGQPFSHVVFAIPGNAVLGISGAAELLEEQDRRFFATCRYGRAITVSFNTPTALGRCYALSIPRVEKLHAAVIEFDDFIDPRRWASGGGRVTVVGGGDTITAEDLLQDFQRIYPGTFGSPEVRDCDIAMPKFPPGRFQELSQFLSRSRRPGLLFCGDYLMGPFIEGAVTSGLRAAQSVVVSS